MFLTQQSKLLAQNTNTSLGSFEHEFQRIENKISDLGSKLDSVLSKLNSLDTKVELLQNMLSKPSKILQFQAF